MHLVPLPSVSAAGRPDVVESVPDDPTYNVSSELTLEVSRSDHNALVTCAVNHPSLGEGDMRTEQALRVLCESTEIRLDDVREKCRYKPTTTLCLHRSGQPSPIPPLRSLTSVISHWLPVITAAQCDLQHVHLPGVQSAWIRGVVTLIQAINGVTSEPVPALPPCGRGSGTARLEGRGLV